MSQLETRPGNDRAFGFVFQLMIADEKGDYEQAAESQRQLANLGWHVSRKPPEQPAKSKRRRSRPAAERTVAE